MISKNAGPEFEPIVALSQSIVTGPHAPAGNTDTAINRIKAPPWLKILARRAATTAEPYLN